MLSRTRPPPGSCFMLCPVITYAFSAAEISHFADPGFASGLPLALTSGTLQARMTVENIDLKTIGFSRSSAGLCL